MPVRTFQVAIRTPSQPPHQPHRPGPDHLDVGHFRASCQVGERREEHVEVRVRASQVPFDSAQDPLAQAQAHHDARDQAAEPDGLPRPAGIR